MPDHHPPHVYLDDTWYIITSATLNHAHFLASEQAKTLVRDTLKNLVLRWSFTLRAWVILDDHYHLLLKTRRGKDLSRFLGQLHGTTSANQLVGCGNWPADVAQLLGYLHPY
jgi:putative transposase